MFEIPGEGAPRSNDGSSDGTHIGKWGKLSLFPRRFETSSLLSLAESWMTHATYLESCPLRAALRAGTIGGDGGDESFLGR